LTSPFPADKSAGYWRMSLRDTMQMKHVTSELFIGRTRELARFHALLASPGLTVLNIHTNGDGGIGKTQLLRRMQQVCAAMPERVAFTAELIDFYHTESRSRVGVMLQIATNFGLREFPDFVGLAAQYHDAIDVSKREELLPQIEEAFRRNYREFSARIHHERQAVIVLFFDTYEVVQQGEVAAPTAADADVSGFSLWLECWLFSHLTPNTRVVVSGRYPLQEINRVSIAVEELSLAHFRFKDTLAFWRHCFGARSENALIERLGSREMLKKFHCLADGRPVLLALFADWVNYALRPLSPDDLLAEIERRSGIIGRRATPKQRDLFERAMIDRIAALQSNQEHAVTYLAVAYRRMTPAMFRALSDLPLDECRRVLLEELRPLSFIKYKTGDCVLLHDEMRRLVVRHWWDAHDDSRDVRRDLARQLVAYYDAHLLTEPELSAAARQIYTSEQLEYAFSADPLDGLDRFRKEFDMALEDGRYDYADLLLREAQRYHQEHPHDIPFPQSYVIELRRSRYYVLTDTDYERAWRIAKDVVEQFREHSAWQEHELLGHFWLARGQAEALLEKFDEAILSFQEAKKIFYDLGEDFWLYRSNYLIGNTFYRQARFEDAERFLSQSLNGFAKLLLEQRDIQPRKYRQMLQGLQLILGNMAEIYGHTGHAEKAIRMAEIALEIVRNLPSNKLEIARAYTNVGHQLALAGYAIDAQRYLNDGEQLLRDIRNRPIIGRNLTDLGVLSYRVDEFSYLLEYYRAEEIEQMLRDYVQYEQIEQAERALTDAARILQEKPVIEKELADAYYTLGELYIVTPSPDHWERAERMFLLALHWGRISKFQYGVIDTLESLVTLYYFWNGASGVSEEMTQENRRKSQAHQREMAQFDPQQYPNLFGKYEVTLGDVEFDIGLDLLKQSQYADTLSAALKALHVAFSHYVKAAVLMKRFNEDRYFLTLRVCYNRLNTLFDTISTALTLEQADCIGILSVVWQGKAPEIEEIYHYLQLRLQPQAHLAEIHQLQASLTLRLEKGQYGVSALLNSCLIGAYGALAESDLAYEERRIHQLQAQAAYYRNLGDDFQARKCLEECRDSIGKLADPALRLALQGMIDCAEGTWRYRRGEYGRLLEIYLQDELGLARARFDQRYPNARAQAFDLLKQGEEKLHVALSSWNADDPASAAFRREYSRQLGEICFRLGELLMLNEQFDYIDGQSGAFSYLRQAAELTAEYGDSYRHDNVMQSYINALYFAGRYDEPAELPRRKAYQQRLEATLTTQGRHPHVSILCRLRIVQADAIFSSCFARQASEEAYLPRRTPVSVRSLRTMLRYYVEACNFMAQHSSKNFAAAVRVLQRRLNLIGDPESLRILQRGFVDVWADQPYLKGKDDERETLIQLANLRSIMLGRGELHG